MPVRQSLRSPYLSLDHIHGSMNVVRPDQHVTHIGHRPCAPPWVFHTLIHFLYQIYRIIVVTKLTQSTNQRKKRRSMQPKTVFIHQPGDPFSQFSNMNCSIIFPDLREDPSRFNQHTRLLLWVLQLPGGYLDPVHDTFSVDCTPDSRKRSRHRNQRLSPPPWSLKPPRNVFRILDILNVDQHNRHSSQYLNSFLRMLHHPDRALELANDTSGGHNVPNSCEKSRYNKKRINS